MPVDHIGVLRTPISLRVSQCQFGFSKFATRSGKGIQREPFLSEVNNRETIVAIEMNNDTYCLQKRIEKYPLIFDCSQR